MAEAAKRDGITLQLSSGFRTYDSQYTLRRNNVIDKTRVNDANYLKTAGASSFYVETGKPGFSNHQNGIAFDIAVKSKISTFEWLSKNAERFGFVRSVPSERWHWEYRPGTKKYFKVEEGHWSWKRENP
jgi:LAS superfamily LD-carboxypeptidase LdcB